MEIVAPGHRYTVVPAPPLLNSPLMTVSEVDESRQVMVDEGEGASLVKLALVVVEEDLEVVEEDEEELVDELVGWLVVEELEATAEVVDFGHDCSPRKPQGVLAAAGAVVLAAVVVTGILLVVVGTGATVTVVVLGQPPKRQFNWRLARRLPVRRLARELSSKPARSATSSTVPTSVVTAPRIESEVKSAAPRKGSSSETGGITGAAFFQ